MMFDQGWIASELLQYCLTYRSSRAKSLTKGQTRKGRCNGKHARADTMAVCARADTMAVRGTANGELRRGTAKGNCKWATTKGNCEWESAKGESAKGE